MKTTMKQHPIIVAVIALLIGVGGIHLLAGTGYPMMSFGRLILTAIMVSIMVTMKDKTLLSTQKGDLHFVFKKSIYVLFLSCFPVLFSLLRFVFEDVTFTNQMMMEVLIASFLCITIGLFEETLFRGVVLRNLLYKTHATRKALIICAIISSLIFGFVHVYPYFLEGSYNMIGLIQVILKTIQCAAFGFLLAALYIKTKNIWAIAIIHIINDFILMVATIVTGSFGLADTYVDSGIVGIGSIFIYLIMFFLYIPAIRSATKILKSIELDELKKKFTTA